MFFTECNSLTAKPNFMAKQLELLKNSKNKSPQGYLTLIEASKWATQFLNKEVTPANISYLLQYGRLAICRIGSCVYIKTEDLKRYYLSSFALREKEWKKKLGKDVNWHLSFDYLREKDTTKHVHRLHPYKGKFIPQLVQYFIDDHTDEFKKQAYFKKGDIILDPFLGSGTTLVQANELGIHSIGIDISVFNCLIAKAKLAEYDFATLIEDIHLVEKVILGFESQHKVNEFEQELSQQLTQYNDRYFPGATFKYELNQGKINEDVSALRYEKDFLNIYDRLVSKYNIPIKQKAEWAFLDKWYAQTVREEIEEAGRAIQKIKSKINREMLSIILSRTIRSCRATTHSDLATLKKPQLTTYYCYKHKKICRPIFSIKKMFLRYAHDTLERLLAFKEFKTRAHNLVITGDSQKIDIIEKTRHLFSNFATLLEKQKIQGIFTSPPYVGQIDYHEQHAYAYELFGLERNDESEIGPLYKGQGRQARESYADGIANVLKNCRRFLAKDHHIFMVANDKYNLYPEIAEKANMKIMHQFKRPVLNRTERDKAPYSESIFYMRGK